MSEAQWQENRNSIQFLFLGTSSPVREIGINNRLCLRPSES